MKLVNSRLVLLQEKEWKAPKVKKGEVAPTSNPDVVGEATVVLSLDERLKKGAKVLINRTGLLDVTVGKKKLIILDIDDILLQL